MRTTTLENRLPFAYKRDIKKFANKFNLTISKVTKGLGYTVYFEESFHYEQLNNMYDEYMSETYEWYNK